MVLSKENKGFLIVFIASLLDLTWLYGLKYAQSTLAYALTIGAIFANFIVLPKAFKYLPTSVAYVVFVGFATLLVVLLDLALLYKDGQDLAFARVFFIFTLLIGVIGIKGAQK